MQVPRNTPEQDHWVDSKWHDLSQESIEPGERFFERMHDRTERANRVAYSPENARKELRNFFSGCSSVTKDLVELKQASPVAEALLWLRLYRYFLANEIVLRDAEIARFGLPKVL